MMSFVGWEETFLETGGVFMEFCRSYDSRAAYHRGIVLLCSGCVTHRDN